ncbi:MAG: TetR/AcrR family transcriptional regulator [Myxococcota bacterium]
MPSRSSDPASSPSHARARREPPESREPEAGRRESAKQATRLALLEAAMAEFAEKGLDAPSLDGICARAGFTRGAFYVHFRDRDDLVAAAMERALNLFLDAVIAGDETAGDLAQVVERYVVLAARGLEDLGSSPPEPAVEAFVPFHQVLAACQRDESVRERLVSILGEARNRVARSAEAGQRAGRLRDDVDPGDAAQLLVLLALGVRVAADLQLPVHVAPTRDALLQLLSGPGTRS